MTAETQAAGRCAEIMASLAGLADEHNRAGMARYGINVSNAFGVPMGALRRIAKPLKLDHALAQALWATGNHEARILAGLVDDPAQVTVPQLEEWVLGFDSWDLCDQICSNLFDRTAFAYDKAVEWAGRPEEFVRRAGLVLMAALAVHDKKATDEVFLAFLPLIAGAADDERNFVKKAVNWALRQIGKRSLGLNAAAVTVAESIRARAGCAAARWIARDALRELTSAGVLARFPDQASSLVVPIIR